MSQSHLTTISPEEAIEPISAAEGGHLGAMDLLIQVYRDGLFDQSRDPARAELWAQRLPEAEAIVH